MRYSYAPRSAAADERALQATLGPPAATAPAYTVIHSAQPYDLTTPGTPAGILALAKAAGEGGYWRAVATLAVAVDAEGAPVASLALRLREECPPAQQRRAWAVYVRTGDAWKPHGAGLLDPSQEGCTMRQLGVAELKCVLAGVPYVPPAPREGPPRLRCYTCDKLTPFSTTAWRPYARHRCEPKTEGRS